MSGRRKRHGIVFERTQDPGKDLFAFMFIVIVLVLFSFMFKAQGGGGLPPQPPGATLQLKDTKTIGKLVLNAFNELIIRFGQQVYDPLWDTEALIKDGRVTVVENKGGGEFKHLYLTFDPNQKVLFAQYLKARRSLGEAGIVMMVGEKIK
jgi:hypothetical protein